MSELSRTCALCGAGATPRKNTCDDCRARILATGHSNARDSIGIYLNAGLVAGGELYLDEIIRRPSSFVLHYTLEGEGIEFIKSGHLHPRPRLQGPWDAEDDRGSTYRGIGGGYSITGGRLKGTVCFVPELPQDVTKLMLRAGREPYFSTTVAIDNAK